MDAYSYNHINDVIQDLYQEGKLGEKEFDLLIECVDKADLYDKYRWHDLRKNPYDLPDENDFNTDYLVLFENSTKEVARFYGRGEYYQGYYEFPNGIWEANGYYDKGVIAWREIEPFKEGEVND